MTDGQSEACLLNEPDHDTPFGPEVERRRREAEEAEAKKPSLLAKIREEIKRLENRAKQRRNQ